MDVGVEWLVEAAGCPAAPLRDARTITATCQRILNELDLHVVGSGQVHQFPDPGGITALYLLTESHLACHTYPEYGVATFNLYCCRMRPAWDWEGRLAECLGARQVTVRRVLRGATVSADFAEPDPESVEVASAEFVSVSDPRGTV